MGADGIGTIIKKNIVQLKNNYGNHVSFRMEYEAISAAEPQWCSMNML